MIEPRSVVVNVLVTKSLEIDEPDWCVDPHTDPAQFKSDILHCGPDVELVFRGRQVGTAGLVQSPYAETLGRGPGVSVSLLGQTLGPAGLDEFAEGLVDHAAALRRLARELADLLGGGR